MNCPLCNSKLEWNDKIRGEQCTEYKDEYHSGYKAGWKDALDASSRNNELLKNCFKAA